ncbi:sugar phosphate isomerase/epimerase family protein [Cohnella panacarvi]|uniref:sugar phosphate isomerase/epimerase family protein n=1 Tax=Cohnella panacarvi TaxID=400776 RepID=UPI00047EB4A8|nr:TIM barrel protein [Cohnella panacarvi]
MRKSSYLSVSTWSLHRLLGPLRWTAWNAATGEHDTHIEDQPQIHSLLELPAEAARRGYQAIEVCHFHLPRTGAAYLAELRAAFDAAGVRFDTMLLDYGDPTSADERRRDADAAFVRRWIDIAAQAGAKQIRVVAGEAPPTDDAAIAQSARTLAELSAYASALDVRVITENFKSLTSTADSCLRLLEQAGDSVGMVTDFGNFAGPAKYDEIAAIAPRSVSVHAKAAYNESGLPDVPEFVRCLEAAKTAAFAGAYVLIYDGPGDMWEGLERIKRIVLPYVAAEAI